MTDFIMSAFDVRHRAVKDASASNDYRTLCGSEVGDYWSFTVAYVEAICRECEEVWARGQQPPPLPTSREEARRLLFGE